MSSHVWLAKRYTPTTLAMGLEALHIALDWGAELELACCFTGYALERIQQAGGLAPSAAYPWRKDSFGLAVFWRRAAYTKHRYSRGKNAVGYTLAGRKVITQYLRPSIPERGTGAQLLQAFAEGQDCAYALHDWLEENGYSEEAGVLRSNPSRKE